MSENDPVIKPEPVDRTKPQGGGDLEKLEHFRPGEPSELPELAEYEPGVKEGVPLFMLYTPAGLGMPQSIMAESAEHPHHWRMQASAYYMAAGVVTPAISELLKPIEEGGQGWTVRRIQIHGLEEITAEQVGEFFVHVAENDLADEPLEDPAANPSVPVQGQVPLAGGHANHYDLSEQELNGQDSPFGGPEL